MPTSPSENYSALSKKYGNQCQSCGTRDASLQIAHIVPIAKGGVHELDNLALVCRNCHHLLRAFRPTELEFEHFLSDVLARSPHYADVARGRRLRTRQGLHLIADIMATRLRTAKSERLLIELKTGSSLRRTQVRGAIERISRYRSIESIDAAALAFPGRLSEDDHAALNAASIEVWDLDYISGAFAKEIDALPFSGLKQLYLLLPQTGGRRTPDALRMKLDRCEPGGDGIAYQKLIRDIFELLFVPPLMPPIEELSDAARANRRDFIMANYAAEGFWKSVRETYDAHYVVVEAKNHKANIAKPQALQLANYLKPHGMGMFGIITTRKGASLSCKHTITEQWAFHRKMIVLLTDEDIQQMLFAASCNDRPEDVIGRAIQRFRLSM